MVTVTMTFAALAATPAKARGPARRSATADGRLLRLTVVAPGAPAEPVELCTRGSPVAPVCGGLVAGPPRSPFCQAI